MNISIIIPTTGGRDTLPRVLEALKGQTESETEILVVFDAETVPPLTSALASRGLQTLCTGGVGLGPSAARNAGAARARGRLLVFIDDDVLPQPGALAALTACAMASDHIAAVGRVVPSPDLPASLYLDMAYAGIAHAPDQADGSLLPFRLFNASLAAVSRSAFDKIGGFEKRLRNYEDAELAYRLLRVGTELRFCARAEGFHARVMDRAWFIARVETIGAQLKQLHRMHHALRRAMPFAPAALRPFMPWLGRSWPAIRERLPAIERLTPALAHRVLRAAHLLGVSWSYHRGP